MPRKTKADIVTETKQERQLRSLQAHSKTLDRKYKSLQDQLTEAETQLEQALSIARHSPKVSSIRLPAISARGAGTVIACLSDVHCDEIVPKSKVNGLNEHNPDIARRRVQRFFDLLVRFIRVDRQETNIKNLILWLGGDFITSSEMHDAHTAMPPVPAIMFAEELVYSGIMHLLTEEPRLNISIVCSVGNHSRIQGSNKPVNQALEQEHSLEWMMYWKLRKLLSEVAGDRVEFQIDNSYHTYVKVYDKVIRFNHGHIGWRYNDGLAGVHGPLWKAITQRWDKQIKADLTICGHYHTYTPAARGRSYIVNGSTIGLSPYSLSYGFEDPIQAYCMVHSKYGIVGQRPLLVNV